MNTPLPFEIIDLGLFRIAVSPDDSDISRQLRSARWYSDEKFETEVFASFVEPGTHVLDLGANIGFYTLLARSRTGPGGRVIAFEPFPKSAALLAASVAANDFANVHLVKAAAGAQDGLARLHLAPDFWTEHSLHDLWGGTDDTSVEVEVTTVDSALARLGGGQRIDVIKMDIEGGEWHALQGMKRVLAENARLTLFTEFWPRGFQRSGITPAHFLHYLRDEGFEISLLDPKACRVERLTVPEIEQLTARMETTSFPDNPVMEKWGWYTNLLCRRDAPQTPAVSS